MYRIATLLAQPFTLAVVLTMAALVYTWWARSTRRLAQAALAVSVLGVVVCSQPVTAHLAIGSLEWQNPPLTPARLDVDAIVVLSGSIRTTGGPVHSPELGESSIVRCLRAASLYRHVGPVPVVVSGGNPDGPGQLAASELMADLLRDLGVAKGDLVLEVESRNTYESALNTAETLRTHGRSRIALVTEATHLPRAAMCFRAQGLDVVPVGCNYRARQMPWSVAGLVPNSTAPGLVQEAVHEWLGIVWYWFNGRFDASGSSG
jgi:uncharacterized SAM-binding protein YcdF (DUF218 family)